MISRARGRNREADSDITLETSTRQRCFPKVDDTGWWEGWVVPSRPPQPQPSPLLSPRRPPNPWVRFSELGWPIGFSETRFFSVQARISMEIETSFFRGPLLTSPSHISIGEWVPGPCSEERGHPSCLLAGGTGGAARDLTAPECQPFCPLSRSPAGLGRLRGRGLSNSWD